MGTIDRSKKRIQPWRKAAIHLSICFAMGFFTGFAPTSTASLFSSHAGPCLSIKNIGISSQPAKHLQKSVENGSLNRSLLSEIPANSSLNESSITTNQEDLLIVITTTSPGDRLRGPLLMRLAHTLKLVPAPLLWVVVGARGDAPNAVETLRRSGIMYRHLTYMENFTDPNAEADHQRNAALSHIEHHRLVGIVHFADVSNTYDLELFDEIRDIDVFGAWPVAMMSANRRRVVVDGPICRPSKVVGWQVKDLGNRTADTRMQTSNGTAEAKPARINISGFAFNSSILWDPERWGRPSSVLDASPDSVKFVQEVAMEDDNKLKAIPSDCSKIMLWHLHRPSSSQ